jgi:hypothetical protein
MREIFLSAIVLLVDYMNRVKQASNPSIISLLRNLRCKIVLVGLLLELYQSGSMCIACRLCDRLIVLFDIASFPNDFIIDAAVLSLVLKLFLIVFIDIIYVLPAHYLVIAAYCRK